MKQVMCHCHSSDERRNNLLSIQLESICCSNDIDIRYVVIIVEDFVIFLSDVYANK